MYKYFTLSQDNYIANLCKVFHIHKYVKVHTPVEQNFKSILIEDAFMQVFGFLTEWFLRINLKEHVQIFNNS